MPSISPGTLYCLCIFVEKSILPELLLEMMDLVEYLVKLLGFYQTEVQRYRDIEIIMNLKLYAYNFKCSQLVLCSNVKGKSSILCSIL